MMITARAAAARAAATASTINLNIVSTSLPSSASLLLLGRSIPKQCRYMSSNASLKIETKNDRDALKLPPNLKIDPRIMDSPFYGMEPLKNKKQRRAPPLPDEAAASGRTVPEEEQENDETKKSPANDATGTFEDVAGDLQDEEEYEEEDEDGLWYDLTPRLSPLLVTPLPDRLRVPILSLADATEVGTIHLSDHVFGMDPIRPDLMHRVVVYQRNKKRGRRKAKTKTISEVSGSGRKVRQQKGTGQARAGHSRPPHWRGGAKAHGPKGSIQDYTSKLNKKVRVLGLKHALSQKLKEGNLILLNELTLESYKTKGLVEKLRRFDVGGRHGTTAFILDESYDKETEGKDEEETVVTAVGGINLNFRVASGNEKKVKVANQSIANVYDMLKYEKLMMSLSALQALEERLPR